MELALQGDTTGNAAEATAFKAGILGSMKLRVFAICRAGTSRIQLIHSIGKLDELGIPKDLRTKLVGFAGDRTVRGDHPPLLLSGVVAFGTKKVKFLSDPLVLTSTYSKSDNRGKVFSWPAENDQTKVKESKLPRMLLLTTKGAIFCGTQERTCSELYEELAHEVASGDDGGLEAKHATLSMEWCMTMSQTTANKSMSFTLEGAPSQDEAVDVWMVDRINMMLGSR